MTTAPDPYDRLFEQRTIMVGGPLDEAAVTELTARLMALDGRSSRPVELVVTSSGGPIAGGLTLIEVMALMRAPVEATALGAVGGTAAAVVACATGDRRATGRATLSLRCTDVLSIEGSADAVAGRAAEASAAQRRLADAVATATGQPQAGVETEIERGRARTAAEAVQWGLIDRIVDGAGGR